MYIYYTGWGGEQTGQDMTSMRRVFCSDGSVTNYKLAAIYLSFMEVSYQLSYHKSIFVSPLHLLLLYYL